MDKRTNLVFLLLPVALGGCASTITALQNGHAEPHTLRPDRFFTITGERRLAFQVVRPADGATAKIAWCAESLPDASQAVSATSKPKLTATGTGEAGIEDEFKTSLTTTFTRTEIAEIYRQMSWQACQAWAQGVYTNEEYKAKMDQIIAAGVAVISARASQPINPAPVPK